MRGVKILIARWWFRYACRALDRPYDPKASARIDRALVALERAKGAA